MTAIDDIKSRIDIVDLVSETVQLRRSGKNYTGFCPFHSNTRTPAFVVFPETGTWRCFGQCNEGGDIFGFLMKKEGWDFSETLKVLAERAGVELRPPTAQEKAAAEEHDSLRALLEEAVIYYRHNLYNSPAGKVALDYLRQKRNLKDETIEVFGLGYSPHAWDAGLNFFKSKDYREDELIAAGLVTVREGAGEEGRGGGEERRIFDRFRHRIIFPIRDERGRMSGFGARILDPEDVPKFLNSPQTVIFDKGHLLYGLDRARKVIRTQDQVVIVEGYLDVIALHQAGYANAVSPMGTALTETQLRLLKKFTRRMVLALDADAAGDQATLRGLQLARQTLDHTSEPVFDARGLLSHEARLQADIRVTTLPPGLDPDEVVNRDPKEWERIIEKARPIVIHVMETLISSRDVNDPKTKTEIAAQVLPLIEDIPSPIERDTYRQRLARLLRVDERILVGVPSVARRSPAALRRRVTAEKQPTTGVEQAKLSPPRSATLLQEGYCLGVLLRRPDLVYRVDRSLQERGLARLSVNDFETSDYQMILRTIEASLAQYHSDPLHFVLNGLSLPLMDLADQLLERTAKLDSNEEKVLEDLLRALVDLRRRRIRLYLNQVRYLLEEPQPADESLLDEYQQTVHNYSQMLKLLDQAYGRFTTHLT
jgi:DNA primase